MSSANRFLDKNMSTLRSEVLNDIYNDIKVNESVLSFTDLDIYSRNSTNFFQKISKSFRQSVLYEDIILTNEQEKCLQLLNKGNLFISAPTSFGKTFIALEFIARNISNMNNIVFVVPTIALMNELREKCYKSFGKTFILITSDSELNQYYNVPKKIIIVVPERISTKSFQQYLNEKQIDLLVYDEIYKLNSNILSNGLNNNGNTSRLIKMNYIYKYLLKRSDKILLLGPFIKSVSFERSKIKIEKFITNLNVVYNEMIYDPNYDDFFCKDNEKRFVYFSTPKRIEDFLSKNTSVLEYSNCDNEIVEWISENIHPDWYYVNYIKQGIGIHHGKTPIFLRKYIENEYGHPKGRIHTIFCTSTLVEGINTPTNNLVIVDAPRNAFELNNLIGRVGRLNIKNPKKGKFYITNAETLNLYHPDDWIDLQILFETEEISSNDIEDECLYLEKELPKESHEKFQSLSRVLNEFYGIQYYEVLDLGIEFKVLENFIECYDTITNYERESKVIQDIKFKILACDNTYLSGLKLKKYSFGKSASNNDYLEFDSVYYLLVSTRGMKGVIDKFTKTYPKYTKNDINMYIDTLFRIDEFIKFSMMKIIAIYELFNLKGHFNKNTNSAFIQSVNMIKGYADSQDGYDRILTDLGFPKQDINLISNKISVFSDVNGTERKLIKFKDSLSEFNKLSPFGKRIVEKISR